MYNCFNYGKHTLKIMKIYIINYKFKINALKSLLSSCRIHNDQKRGQRIFDKINIILDIYLISSVITKQLNDNESIEDHLWINNDSKRNTVNDSEEFKSL